MCNAYSSSQFSWQQHCDVHLCSSYHTQAYAADSQMSCGCNTETTTTGKQRIESGCREPMKSWSVLPNA